jgi:DNA-binding transcriptional MerR regulator
MEIKYSTNSLKDFSNEFGIDGQKLHEFLPKVITPLVLPSELDISSRVFHYWREKGLLKYYPIVKTQRSDWVKLNLLEVLWLKIVQQLLQFGFNIKDIKAIGDNLNLDLMDKLTESDAAPEIKKLKLKKDTENYYLNLISVIKNNPELINKEFLKLFTFLGSIVSDILLFKGNINLIIYTENGEIMIAMDGMKHNKAIETLLLEMKTRTRLIIPINSLLIDFLREEASVEQVIDFGLCSPSELAAIDAIRNKEVKEVNIKKDDFGEITLTTTKVGGLKEADMRQLIKIFGLTDYKEVKVVMRNKKDIFLEGKTKYKY